MKNKKVEKACIIGMRCLFLLLFPAVFSTAFSGIQYLIEQIGKTEPLQMNLFILECIVIGMFTILAGRFFCGFACAFGIYGDFMYFLSTKIRKRAKKRPMMIPKEVTRRMKYLKYLILMAILLFCFLGKKDWVVENSPWTVFSRILALKSPEGNIALVLFIIVSICMMLEEHFFCRFLCPMGAVFSLLPVIPFSSISRKRENCIPGCRACQMKCPAGIEIADDSVGEEGQMGECFSCGKCIQTCPRENVHSGKYIQKEKVFFWQLIRGVILLVLLFVIE